MAAVDGAPDKSGDYPPVIAIPPAGRLLDSGGHHRRAGLLLANDGVRTKRSAGSGVEDRPKNASDEDLGEGRLRGVHADHHSSVDVCVSTDGAQRAACTRDGLGFTRTARAIICDGPILRECAGCAGLRCPGAVTADSNDWPVLHALLVRSSPRGWPV